MKGSLRFFFALLFVQLATALPIQSESRCDRVLAPQGYKLVFSMTGEKEEIDQDGAWTTASIVHESISGSLDAVSIPMPADYQVLCGPLFFPQKQEYTANIYREESSYYNGSLEMKEVVSRQGSYVFNEDENENPGGPEVILMDNTYSLSLRDLVDAVRTSSYGTYQITTHFGLRQD